MGGVGGLPSKMTVPDMLVPAAKAGMAVTASIESLIAFIGDMLIPLMGCCKVRILNSFS